MNIQFDKGGRLLIHIMHYYSRNYCEDDMDNDSDSFVLSPVSLKS